ncbi:membrane protein EE45 [Proboscivirus elephantidbeta5]|uniref:Membrane protein EE45 n=1 Tax=Elephant endotheliotropic herpesvirus 5 TaxID=768738 RepID=A0A075CZS3_9BETA|nr:membrane protein EE45 [Elephant endotheliotropic herpesvirus 5]AHC02819.1 membrane protein EE45 [Elephant endotheliotropic herpesvirus 5]
MWRHVAVLLTVFVVVTCAEANCTQNNTNSSCVPKSLIFTIVSGTNGFMLFSAVLGIVFTVAAFISFVIFALSNRPMCFPFNTWYTQFLFLAGVIIVFVLVILYVCRPSIFDYFGPLPFVICFSCLLVNAFDLVLIYRYRIGLSSWTLLWMAFFCIFINPIVLFQVDMALIYAKTCGCFNTSYLNNTVNATCWNATEIYNNTSKSISIVTHLDTALYSYPYYLMAVAMFLTLFSFNRSLYSNYMFLTLLVSLLIWTIHWLVVSLLPSAGLALANGYAFLLLYVLPPIIYRRYERKYLSADTPKTTSRQGRPQTTL